MITIVIPTKNRCNDLVRCLRSLQKQTWKNFEILVVDNGSTDDTVEVAKKYGATVIVETTSNLSRLFNLGWKLARTDVVAYLNDDAEAVPEWAGVIHDFLSKEKEIKALGGPTIATRQQRMFSIFKQSEGSKLLGLAFKIYNYVIMEGRFFEIGNFDEWGNSTVGGSLPYSARISNPRPVQGLSITNLAIRKETLAEIGGFDESFRYVHSDGDLFLRLRKRGYKMVFHPRMVVFHHLNPIGYTRSPYFWGRDFALLWLKHANKPKSKLLSLMHLFFITGYLGFLSDIPQQACKLWLKGLLDGLNYYLKNKRFMLR